MSTTVENTSGFSAEQPITLMIDDAGVEKTTMLLLEGGDTETVAFANVLIGDVGTYALEVSSGDETVVGTVTVTEGGVDNGNGVTGEDTAAAQPGSGSALVLLALLGGLLLFTWPRTINSG